MKKTLSVLLSVATLATMAVGFTACGDKEVDYKLGMGVVVNLDSSKKDNAQVDATVATVVTDKDGKIVACRLDVAQNKMNVKDGKIGKIKNSKNPDVEEDIRTKYELKGDYTMSQYGSVNWNPNDKEGLKPKEWFEQAAAFENYVVGKTGAEVKTASTDTQEVNNHNISKDENLLNAGCTIEIGEFGAAIEKACNDEFAVSFKAKADSFKLGVKAISFVEEGWDGSKDAEQVCMYTDFAASAVSAEGKILASLNDAIQPKIYLDAEGNTTIDKEPGKHQSYKGTKRELKEGYMMSTLGKDEDRNGDGKVLEWYLQSAEFSKYVIGMTKAEVEAIATQKQDDGYEIAAPGALLNAGCTIQITAIKAVVAGSVEAAR